MQQDIYFGSVEEKANNIRFKTPIYLHPIILQDNSQMD